MKLLRPNNKRAKTAIVLIWIVLGLEVVSIISNYMQYNMVKDILIGVEYTDKELELNDTRERLVGLVYIIAWLSSGITFIMWFRRAYYNLGLLTKTEYKDSWAVWSWIVPIISFLRPYSMMSELYSKAISVLKSYNISYNKDFKSHILVWWWGLHIIGNIMSWGVFRLSSHIDTIDSLLGMTVLNTVLNVLGIISALITIKVVKDYSDIEYLLPPRKKYEEKII